MDTSDTIATASLAVSCIALLVAWRAHVVSGPRIECDANLFCLAGTDNWSLVVTFANKGRNAGTVNILDVRLHSVHVYKGAPITRDYFPHFQGIRLPHRLESMDRRTWRADATELHDRLNDYILGAGRNDIRAEVRIRAGGHRPRSVRIKPMPAKSLAWLEWVTREDFILGAAPPGDEPVPTVDNETAATNRTAPSPSKTVDPS